MTKDSALGLDTKDITLTALCAALMAVCSWISVPASVPFTMQTFGVFLTVGLLGGKRGTLSIIVYLILGAAGLPVFAGFNGGIGHLMGATGGYILGFVFSAAEMWLAERFFGHGLKPLVISMVIGLLICYAFGTAWFVAVYSRESGSIGVMTALAWCVLPYIIPDALKIVLAAVMTRRLRPQLESIL